MQHGFGMITMPDGRTLKGKFENNVFMGKVKDDTKKPLPLPVIEEDVEEKMQTSPEPVQKYEIMVQTDPIIPAPPKMKEKTIQTKKEPVKKIKITKMKEKVNQTREGTPPKKIQMKEKVIQTRKEEQPGKPPVPPRILRSVITQTPAQKYYANEEIQTHAIQQNTEV